MPTYEYDCSLCRHVWETNQSIKDPPLDRCPKCDANTARRLISRTSFKLLGDGWAADRYSTAGKSSGRS